MDPQKLLRKKYSRMQMSPLLPSYQIKQKLDRALTSNAIRLKYETAFRIKNQPISFKFFSRRQSSEEIADLSNAYQFFRLFPFNFHSRISKVVFSHSFAKRKNDCAKVAKLKRSLNKLLESTSSTHLYDFSRFFARQMQAFSPSIPKKSSLKSLTSEANEPKSSARAPWEKDEVFLNKKLVLSKKGEPEEHSLSTDNLGCSLVKKESTGKLIIKKKASQAEIQIVRDEKGCNVSNGKVDSGFTGILSTENLKKKSNVANLVIEIPRDEEVVEKKKPNLKMLFLQNEKERNKQGMKSSDLKKKMMSQSTNMIFNTFNSNKKNKIATKAVMFMKNDLPKKMLKTEDTNHLKIKSKLSAKRDFKDVRPFF